MHYRASYDRYKRIEKVGYPSLQEAEFVALATDTKGVLRAYLCPYCLLWHNGHVDENSTSKVDSPS